MKSFSPAEYPNHVLLIDQDLSLQTDVANWLRVEGCRVHCESDGLNGLKYWQQHHPDVAICDVSSEGVNGLEVLQEIKHSSAETQVIMVSEAGEKDEVVEALRLGASDYLIKPISDSAVLTHAVRRALEEHHLIQQNRVYREQLEAKNRELKQSLRLLKEDQEAGRAVQLKMLPANRKSFDNVNIEYRIIPSLYLSGDFLDFFSLGEGRIGFYLADVSGHGASSAFVTVLLKTMANRLKQQYRNNETDWLMPAEILQNANKELRPLGLGKHLAIFCGYINCHKKKMVFSSAAHFPPPILVTNGKTIALEGKGLPVGLFEEVSYENQELELGDSFNLVLFSDGVLEVMEQGSVAEKERHLMEIVSQGIHNIGQLSEHLNLDSLETVPDDIALLTVSCNEPE